MTKQDYTSSFSTTASAQEAFDKICRPLEWWAKNFEGESTKVGDVFTVRFKSGDWFKIKIAELIPGAKITWDVLDAEQTWIKNHKEWVGTKIVFEILPQENGSKVTMTHNGLTPEIECYEKCKMAWDYLTKQSLYKYLADGVGTPA